MAGHITDSLSVCYLTPDPILDLVRDVWKGQIDLDPCSNPYSRTNAKRTFSLEDETDGLVLSWGVGSVFMNPPFGKGWYKTVEDKRHYLWPAERAALKASLSPEAFKAEMASYKSVSIYDWIKKASEHKGPVIGLIPVTPSTKAWREFVFPKAGDIYFPPHRLHFVLNVVLPDGSVIQKDGPAPMDVCLVYWGNTDAFACVFQNQPGSLVTL